jgi:hypothetical protein
MTFCDEHILFCSNAVYLSGMLAAVAILIVLFVIATNPKEPPKTPENDDE